MQEAKGNFDVYKLLEWLGEFVETRRRSKKRSSDLSDVDTPVDSPSNDAYDDNGDNESQLDDSDDDTIDDLGHLEEGTTTSGDILIDEAISILWYSSFNFYHPAKCFKIYTCPCSSSTGLLFPRLINWSDPKSRPFILLLLLCPSMTTPS